MYESTNNTSKQAQSLTETTDKSQPPSLDYKHSLQWPRIDNLTRNGTSLYPPATGNFPLVYSPPLPAAHYIYLDLFQTLCLESELQRRLSLCHPMFDCKNHSDQSNKNGRNRNSDRTYHTNNCFCINNHYDLGNVHCPYICCPSCQNNNCSCCACLGQKCKLYVENKITKYRYCHHSDSWPSFNSKHQSPISHSQYPKLTCHSVSQCSYIHSNNKTEDIPERETALNKKSSNMFRMTDGQILSSPNSAKQTNEKLYMSSNTTKYQTNKTIDNRDYRDCENGRLKNENISVLDYCGATGDENLSATSDNKENCIKKSTAYFLPISTLTKTK